MRSPARDMEEDVTLPSVSASRERLLPVQGDHQRWSSSQDTWWANDRSGTRVQHAECDDRHGPPSFLRHRSMKHPWSGPVRARFDSCTNACAGKARSRRTRCRDVIFETLFETLWVSNPIRPRSATSRNRVMRGPGVTQGAKRSQGVRRRRVIEPRNALVARADVVRWTEGYIAASERPWRRGPRRGRSAWHAGGWVSREPGRPHRLHLKGCRGAGTGSPSPRTWTWHLASDGANPQVLGWYRRAKATKRGGGAARNRSVS